MIVSVNDLIEKVVNQGYCIGCGVCVAIDNSPLKMILTENGRYEPRVNEESLTDVKKEKINRVCPFYESERNENVIVKELFSSQSKAKSVYAGYYNSMYAGFVKNETIREASSSGGITTWIAEKLLMEKLVDGIIHVKESEDNSRLFEYKISGNIKCLREGKKSKYYPVELSKVLRKVRESNKKYALVGVPCFIKAVRLLLEEEPVMKGRLPYFIGLACGHLKSKFFADSIAWELGIKPGHLRFIDFRVKLEGRKANDYGVRVCSDEKDVTHPVKDLFVGNWGHGMFKYKACDFCDDVLAETADITLGDAWLPKYIDNNMGTNIIIVRNKKIQSIFNKYRSEIFLEPIDENELYKTQEGGFRHRRMGLAYRLFIKDIMQKWRPLKRVEPNQDLNNKFKKIYKLRYKLSVDSSLNFLEALEMGDFGTFIELMLPLLEIYEAELKKPRVEESEVFFNNTN